MPGAELYGEFTDESLIKSELEALREMAHEQDGMKRDIILRAASKLEEKYDSDLTVISARLQAILCRDKTKHGKKEYLIVSKAYIIDILPDQYKRSYAITPENDDTPVDALEEFILRAADVAKSISSLCNSTLRDIQALRRSKDEHDVETYEAIVEAAKYVISHEFHEKVMAEMKIKLSTIRHVDDLVEMVKHLQAEAATCGKLADKRHKFSTAVKILLKMVFTFRSYDHIASTLSNQRRYGGKWLSSINRDPELARFLKIIECPQCHFGFERWMEQTRTNMDAGLEPPPPDAVFCAAEIR